jgi:hypothetical protein
MLSALRLAFVVAGGLGLVSAAHADGLLYRLPADGTWVRYALRQQTVPAPQKNAVIVGTLTLASVGEEKVNNQACRWIEVVIDTKEPGGLGLKTVFKALIPERRLQKGQNPSRYWLKGWGKLGDLPPQPLTRELLTNPAMIINLVVSGPLESARDLPEKLIETKLGKLECHGIAGTLTYPGAAVRLDKGKKTTKDLTVRVETYLHETAPFGVLASRQQVTFPDFGSGASSVDMDLTLLDAGTDAKTELPDHQ